MKRYGQPHVIVTDKLRSYGAAMKVIGNAKKQETGRWLNDEAETSHLPFRRIERAMLRFRQLPVYAVWATFGNHRHRLGAGYECALSRGGEGVSVLQITHWHHNSTA